MALPSIALSVLFAAACGVAGAVPLGPAWRGTWGPGGAPVLAVLPPVAAGIGAWAHWRRFRVPVDVAIGASAACGAAVVAFLAAIDPLGRPGAVFAIEVLAMLLGVGLFALGLWWDAGDRARATIRADVAFWLHLAAAPAIVHPLFLLLGLTHLSAGGAARAAAAIGVYLVLGLVAVAVDRRTMLVSGIAYLLAAIAAIVRRTGGVGDALAVSALVIGAALLALSVWWQPIRGAILRRLPRAWTDRLAPARDA